MSEVGGPVVTGAKLRDDMEEAAMAVTALRTHQRAIQPLHAVLLAGTVPLFLAALLSDIVYAASYEVQWKNFASWLIIGGLVFGGFALLLAVIGLFRSGRRTLYFGLLLATWILGFINALVHAKDAWASMPEGLILSVIIAALAIAATGFGFSSRLAAKN